MSSTRIARRSTHSSGASVRCLAAGSSQRADFYTGSPFLIVEEGFVVIRRARGHRAIVVCHAGAGALLIAPEPGETLDALVESRVTLVTERVTRPFSHAPASPRSS